jgi:hypothetical protein
MRDAFAGDHHMQALAALTSGQLSNPSCCRKQPQLQGGLDHEIPADAATGIKIEDELIGVLDHPPSPPRMDLDHVHLDEAEKAFKAVRHIRTLSPPAASGGPAPQTSGSAAPEISALSTPGNAPTQMRKDASARTSAMQPRRLHVPCRSETRGTPT